MGIWFGLTLFVSAFLLFVLQPMFAKMVLPLLGGAPAVWNTCLVFFQLALLAGYAYAHAAPARLGVRRQARYHVLLLLTPLLMLPVSLPPDVVPPQGQPAGWLLGLLVARVGLPFFVVATSAPLLQTWFAHTTARGARNPYVLYAASNAGSLLALLSYPFLIEPRWRLAEQTRLWAAAYAVFVVLVSGCALFLWRSGPATVPEAAPPTHEAIPCRRRLRWVLLSLVPSSLLLGVTTYISMDLAAVPLLWVIPLSLYLLSFVLVFAARPPIPHRWMLRLLPFVVLPVILLMIGRVAGGPWWLIPLHLLLFFTAAMVCHGELARDRPAPVQLTEFYLWMAVGGACGGLLNALIAPLVFRSIAEYPLAIVLACLALSGPASDRSSRRLDVLLPAGLGMLFLLLQIGVHRSGADRTLAGGLWQYGVPAILCYACSRRPLRFGLAVGFLLLAGLHDVGGQPPLHTARSFFGVHRVARRVLTAPDAGAGTAYHELYHGTTLHGRQSLDPARRCEPLSYYHREGPLGEVFAAIGGRLDGPRIAVIGLGTGSIGGYAAAGQDWTFYEIDSEVERTARDPRLFTFLRDCLPSVRVVLGDGRVSLRQAPDRSYSLLIVDAFGSDAVPVHLLTREAVVLYLSKLTDHGVLVFHLSNRYLRLAPVVGNIAGALGLWGIVQFQGTLTDAQQAAGANSSEWAVVVRRPEDAGALRHDPRWMRLPYSAHVPIWTDDFSNLLSVLRR